MFNKLPVDMTEEELHAFLDHPMMPSWAIRKSNGDYEMGTQLPTKDGRKIGNAHIINIGPAFWNDQVLIYTCLTDAGTELRFVREELIELFHVPAWVSDVPDVLRKFANNE